MYTDIVNKVSEIESQTKKKNDKRDALEGCIANALRLVKSREEFLGLPFLIKEGSATNLGDIGTKSNIFWIDDLIQRHNIDSIKIVGAKYLQTGYVFNDSSACLQNWKCEQRRYEYTSAIFYESEGKVPRFEII